jgi:hypothetical protein
MVFSVWGVSRCSRLWSWAGFAPDEGRCVVACSCAAPGPSSVSADSPGWSSGGWLVKLQKIIVGAVMEARAFELRKAMVERARAKAGFPTLAGYDALAG